LKLEVLPSFIETGSSEADNLLSAYTPYCHIRILHGLIIIMGSGLDESIY
jgi:hypothetical protein